MCSTCYQKSREVGLRRGTVPGHSQKSLVEGSLKSLYRWRCCRINHLLLPIPCHLGGFLLRILLSPGGKSKASYPPLVSLYSNKLCLALGSDCDKAWKLSKSITQEVQLGIFPPFLLTSRSFLRHKTKKKTPTIEIKKVSSMAQR